MYKIWKCKFCKFERHNKQMVKNHICNEHQDEVMEQVYKEGEKYGNNSFIL